MSETGAYPRDMVGYAGNLPDAKWPGGARIAVQFVINYEEGAENSVLHGDRGSEAFLSEMVGAQSIPGARAIAMESLYEYGSRAGFWRLHRIFTQRRQPLTVFAVAAAMARNPAAVAAMKDAGWKSPPTACAGSTTSMCPRRWSVLTFLNASRCMKS